MARDPQKKRSLPVRFFRAVLAGTRWLAWLFLMLLRFLGWLGGVLFLALLVVLFLLFGLPDFDPYLTLPKRADGLEERLDAHAQQIEAQQRRIDDISEEMRALEARLDQLRLSSQAEPPNLSIPEIRPIKNPEAQYQAAPKPIPLAEDHSSREEAPEQPESRTLLETSLWVAGGVFGLIVILAVLGNLFGDATPGYGAGTLRPSSSGSHPRKAA